MNDNLKNYLVETQAKNDCTKVTARLLLKDLASLITDIRCLQHLIEGATKEDGDEPSLWVEELKDDKATLEEVKRYVEQLYCITTAQEEEVEQ